MIDMENNLLQEAKLKFERFDVSKQKELSFKTTLGDLEFSSYLFVKENSDKLFVMLSGALNSDRKTAFTYHRWSWNEIIDGSVLYIADPVLSINRDLNIGWYIGTEDIAVDKYIAEFVSFIALNLKIELNHVVAYGSSAGGFAAMQLASNIKNNMLAVAINPQTNVFDYLDKPVNLFIEKCWSKSIPSNCDIRFNLNFKDLGNTKILYIQNLSDSDHYDKHMLPFLKTVGVDNTDLPVEQQQGMIRIMKYDHPSGHAAEPKEMLPEIFKAINHMVDENNCRSLNYFILGSCVSRDVFTPNRRDDIESSGYYPRTSFARLALDEVNTIPVLDSLSSPFQRKIVQQDMRLDVLESLNDTKFDFILIDLIDERYGLVEYGNTYITNSFELNQSGILGDISKLNTIKVDSEEFYELWKKGFEIFIKYCVNNNLKDKIVVNKVFWADSFESGQSIPNFDTQKIRLNNSVLDRFYKLMANYLVESQFIEYPEDFVVAKADHKWGVMPFHYVDDFYNYSYIKLKK